MDIQVYSLARRETVPLSAVSAVICRKDTPEEFYENCIGIFPIVLGPMSAVEIDGLRSLTEWQYKPPVGNTERTSLIYKMQKASQCVHYQLTPPVADEFDLSPADAPLLASWKAFGAALYGREDFVFNFVDVLRRDAAPVEGGKVVGSKIHDDLNFDLGHRSRGLSILSIVADEHLHSETITNPWWTTQWHDMRDLPLVMHKEWKLDHARENTQRNLQALCPGRPLPAGQHCMFPTWMLHSAFGGRLCPAGDPTPQPQVYVSHAVISKPQASLFKPELNY